MNYIIDIAILVIFAVCIITGVIKGFVKSLMDLITNIAAVIIARILSVQLAPQMFERFFENSIATRLESEIATLGSSATEQVQSALDSIPESMNGFLSLLGMDVQALTDSLSQQISASGGNVLDALMVNVVAPVMTVILKIILFVAIFVLCIFILKLFTVIFEKFAKLPVIKQANGIFGGMFGAVKGIVVAINSKAAGNTRNHLFLADKNVTGGYYSYQMDADPVADLGIEVGMIVEVSGPVSPYSGMQEIKGGQDKIDALVTELNGIVADINDEITDGSALKPDYTAWETAEGAYDALDKTNVKSEIIAEADALKAEIAGKQNDGTLTQATATQAEINEATARRSSVNLNLFIFFIVLHCSVQIYYIFLT